MKDRESLIEALLERTEQYSKSSFELLKLKSLDKTADVTSTLVSRFFLAMAISIFVLILNIGIALWLGEILGKNYYGFLLVAIFYGLVGLSLLLLHPKLKARISNSIISQVLN